jgi:hypothetical protein
MFDCAVGWLILFRCSGFFWKFFEGLVYYLRMEMNVELSSSYFAIESNNYQIHMYLQAFKLFLLWFGPFGCSKFSFEHCLSTLPVWYESFCRRRDISRF